MTIEQEGRQADALYVPPAIPIGVAPEDNRIYFALILEKDKEEWKLDLLAGSPSNPIYTIFLLDDIFSQLRRRPSSKATRVGGDFYRRGYGDLDIFLTMSP